MTLILRQSLHIINFIDFFNFYLFQNNLYYLFQWTLLHVFKFKILIFFFIMMVDFIIKRIYFVPCKKKLLWKKKNLFFFITFIDIMDLQVILYFNINSYFYHFFRKTFIIILK